MSDGVPPCCETFSRLIEVEFQKTRTDWLPEECGPHTEAADLCKPNAYEHVSAADAVKIYKLNKNKSIF